MEEGLKVQVSSGKCSEDRRLEDGRQKTEDGRRKTEDRRFRFASGASAANCLRNAALVEDFM
jgi:hypothetical protein